MVKEQLHENHTHIESITSKQLQKLSTTKEEGTTQEKLYNKIKNKLPLNSVDRLDLLTLLE